MNNKSKKKSGAGKWIGWGIFLLFALPTAKLYALLPLVILGGLAYFFFGNKLDVSQNLKKSPRQKAEEELRKQKEAEELAKQKMEEQRAKYKSAHPEVDEVIEKGWKLLNQIRKSNSQIPDVEFTQNIQELENKVVKILKVVYNQPGDALQVRKFMNYYLPTTIKMLEKYAEYEQLGYESPAVWENKQKIKDAVNVVIGACDKQLETLYKDDILDINTDIQALEQMLQRDGLLETPLQKIQKQIHADFTNTDSQSLNRDISALERSLQEDGYIETEWEKIQKQNGATLGN